MALKVAVNGTPMLPTGMYTTVWFGELTISFWASMASCWMYMSLNWYDDHATPGRRGRQLDRRFSTLDRVVMIDT